MQVVPLARTDVRMTAHRGRVSLAANGWQLVLSCGEEPRYALHPLGASPQDGTTERGTWSLGELPGLLARLGAAS